MSSVDVGTLPLPQQDATPPRSTLRSPAPDRSGKLHADRTPNGQSREGRDDGLLFSPLRELAPPTHEAETQGSGKIDYTLDALPSFVMDPLELTEDLTTEQKEHKARTVTQKAALPAAPATENNSGTASQEQAESATASTTVETTTSTHRLRRGLSVRTDSMNNVMQSPTNAEVAKQSEKGKSATSGKKSMTLKELAIGGGIENLGEMVAENTNKNPVVAAVAATLTPNTDPSLLYGVDHVPDYGLTQSASSLGAFEVVDLARAGSRRIDTAANGHEIPTVRVSSIRKPFGQLKDATNISPARSPRDARKLSFIKVKVATSPSHAIETPTMASDDVAGENQDVVKRSKTPECARPVRHTKSPSRAGAIGGVPHQMAQSNAAHIVPLKIKPIAAGALTEPTNVTVAADLFVKAPSGGISSDNQHEPEFKSISVSADVNQGVVALGVQSPMSIASSYPSKDNESLSSCSLSPSSSSVDLAALAKLCSPTAPSQMEFVKTLKRPQAPAFGNDNLALQMFETSPQQHAQLAEHTITAQSLALSNVRLFSAMAMGVAAESPDNNELVDLDAETVNEAGTVADMVSSTMRERAALERKLRNQPGEVVSPGHVVTPLVSRSNGASIGERRERSMRSTPKSLAEPGHGGRPRVYVTHLKGQGAVPIGTVRIENGDEDDDIVTKAESDAETEFDNESQYDGEKTPNFKRVRLSLGEQENEEAPHLDVAVYYVDRPSGDGAGVQVGGKPTGSGDAADDAVIRPESGLASGLVSPVSTRSMTSPRKSLGGVANMSQICEAPIDAAAGDQSVEPTTLYGEIAEQPIEEVESKDTAKALPEVVSASELPAAEDDDEDMQFTAVVPISVKAAQVLSAKKSENRTHPLHPVSEPIQDAEDDDGSDMEGATTLFHTAITVNKSHIQENKNSAEDVTQMSMSSLSAEEGDATASMEFTMALNNAIKLPRQEPTLVSSDSETNPATEVSDETPEIEPSESQKRNEVDEDHQDDDMLLTTVVPTVLKAASATKSQTEAEQASDGAVASAASATSAASSGAAIPVDLASTTVELGSDDDDEGEDMELTELHTGKPVMKLQESHAVAAVAPAVTTTTTTTTAPPDDAQTSSLGDDMEETAVINVSVKTLQKSSALASPTNLKRRRSSRLAQETTVQNITIEDSTLANEVPSHAVAPNPTTTAVSAEPSQTPAKDMEVSTIDEGTSFGILDTYLPKPQSQPALEAAPLKEPQAAESSHPTNVTNSTIPTEQLLEYVDELAGVDVDAVTGIGNTTKAFLKDIQQRSQLDVMNGKNRRRSRKSSLGTSITDDSLASTAELSLDPATHRRVINSIPEDGDNDDDDGDINIDEVLDSYDGDSDESFTLAPNGEVIAKFKAAKAAKAAETAKAAKQLVQGSKQPVGNSKRYEDEDDDDSILGEETRAFIRGQKPHDLDSTSASSIMLAMSEAGSNDPSSYSLLNNSEDELSISSPQHKLSRRDRRSSILSPVGSPRFSSPSSQIESAASSLEGPKTVNTLQSLMALAELHFETESGGAAEGKRRDSEFGLAGRAQRLSMLFKRSPDDGEENDDDEIQRDDLIHQAVLALDDSGTVLRPEELYASSVDAVEMDSYAQGCVQLMAINEESAAAVQRLVEYIDRVSPRPFSDLIRQAMKSSEGRKAVQRDLRQANLSSRLNASNAWYLWRGDLLAETKALVERHAESLKEDARIAKDFAQQFRKLRAIELANADPEIQELRAAVAEHADVVKGSIQERDELQQQVETTAEHIQSLENELQELHLRVETEREQALASANGDVAQARASCSSAESMFAWTRSLGAWNVIPRVAINTNTEIEIASGAGLDLVLKPPGSPCWFQMIVQWNSGDGKLFGLPELFLHVQEEELSWSAAERYATAMNNAACALNSLINAGGALNTTGRTHEEIRIMSGLGMSVSAWMAQKRVHVEAVRAMYLAVKPSFYEMLNQCRTQTKVAPCAMQLGLRLQHIIDIATELERIVAAGSAQILVETPRVIAPASGNNIAKYAPAAITVTVTSASRKQINVRLELSELYPRCDFASTATVEVLGYTRVQRAAKKQVHDQVMQVLRTQVGYGRLTKICDALRGLIE